jgi:hypothetical protein
LLEVRENISKTHQICIFDFQCVAKNIKGYLKFCTSYLVCNQIWLNLLRDDCHFLYIIQVARSL